jgi:hypothetical protein
MNNAHLGMEGGFGNSDRAIDGGLLYDVDENAIRHLVRRTLHGLSLRMP